MDIKTHHIQIKLAFGLSLYFAISFIFSEAVTRYATKLSPILNPETVLFALSLGIFCGAAVSIFNSLRLRRTISIVILFLSAVFYSAETVLFRSFGFFYSPEIMLGMAGAVVGSYTQTTLNSVIASSPYILLQLLPFAAYLTLYIPRVHLPTAYRTSPKNNIRCFSVLLGICLLINASAGVLVAHNDDNNYLYSDGYDFDLTAKHLGLSTSLRLNAQRATSLGSKAAQSKNDSPSEIDVPTPKDCNITDELYSATTPQDDEKLLDLKKYLLSKTPTAKNPMTGILKDKNLIFICAEALSPYAISESLTPTLYELCHNGLYFEQYYSPSFGESTSGGEYSLLLSQVPKRDAGEKGMSMYLSKNNLLDHSLSGYFAKTNYICNGYHNNSYKYYNRNLTHPAMGMNWYGRGGCVTIEAKAPNFDIGNSLSNGWPGSDVELIDATYESYTERAKSENRHFFTYYLTVSGHSNYTFSGNTISSKNQSYTADLPYSDTVKAYLAAQKELDLALDHLVNKLKSDELLDKTVIVIANDHAPYGLSPTWLTNNGKDYLSELAGNKLSTTPELERGALIIYSSEFSNGLTISAPTSSFDVLPTLLNMFGIKFDSRFFCGKDVFSGCEPLVFFSDGSFVSTVGVYEANTKRFSSNAPLEPKTRDEYIKLIKKQIRDTVKYSKLIRQTDLFAKFETRALS